MTGGRGNYLGITKGTKGKLLRRLKRDDKILVANPGLDGSRSGVHFARA